MDIGVVIGRFQIDRLHDGHLRLLDYVTHIHEKTIVFLGCASYIGTKHNPLDYPTRVKMIRATYPNVVVLPQLDNQSDKVWSKNLDNQIRLVFPNVTKAILYGGRDSFIPHYCGEFTTKNVQEIIDDGTISWSSTERREQLGARVDDSVAFRHGVIYALQNYSFPHVRLAVDAALVKWEPKTVEIRNIPPNDNQVAYVEQQIPQLLMGRKGNETGWRIPGGMVDPTDDTAEQAVRRELREETTIECTIVNYIGTYKVNDWRSRKTKERGVMTCLYHIPYVSGLPEAKDDLCEIRWVELCDAYNLAIPDHKPLIEELINYLKKKGYQL